MVILLDFSIPTEGIRHQQPQTMAIKNKVEIGVGTLFIAESALSWRNDTTGEGFSAQWPQIGVAALTREGQVEGVIGHLYIQVTKTEDDGFDSDDCDSTDSDFDCQDYDKTIEIKFIPEAKNELEAMYHAITDCQNLCVDPVDEESENDEFLDADEDEDAGEYILAGGDSGFIEGLNNLAITNGGNHVSLMEAEGQFEDAEEEDYNEIH